MNLWFNNAVNQLPDELGNYWEDDLCSVPASALPVDGDTVEIVTGYVLASSETNPLPACNVFVRGTLTIVDSLTLSHQIIIYAGAELVLNGSLQVAPTAFLQVEMGATLYGAGTLSVALGSVVLLYGVQIAPPPMLSPNDVRDDTDLGDGLNFGNLIIPPAEHVKLGEHAGWHEIGRNEIWEITGTYSGGVPPPSVPTLTFADAGDGSGGVAEVAGATAGSMNQVYTVPRTGGLWTLSGTRTGDGTLTLSLAVGGYLAYVLSSLDGAYAVSAAIAITVTDADAETCPLVSVSDAIVADLAAGVLEGAFARTFTPRKLRRRSGI